MKSTIEYLRKYNEWRRGAETEQPDPNELGKHIDAAIAQLETTEKAVNNEGGTPETNALVESINSDTDICRHDSDFIEMTWLARKLEMERDEARVERDSLQALSQSLSETCTKLKRERDEAIGRWKEIAEIRNQIATQFQTRAIQAEQECDRLRKYIADMFYEPPLKTKP